ncbi:MAG: universal stress protein [Sorangiineae bacterium]|nr:universal stress protein [Polyangiaceae bacterium]MEB2321962.1 universal stress protein [Sorangiineae bacterium]
MAFEIVAGVDYSAPSELALARALELLAHRPDARLHVITVAAGAGPRLPEELTLDAKERFLSEARATLERHLDEQVAARPGLRERLLLAVDFGDPAERILALAKSADADLVVVGTRNRRGVERLLLGSVAETVLRNAGCPVLVMRERRASSG